MALDIDGFAVFLAIGQAPERFAAIAPDVAKAARTLLTKQLKSKNLTAADLHGLQLALGEEAFGLILDGFKLAELRSVLGKADRHYAELKSADAGTLRQRLIALAGGAEASVKTVSAKAKAAKPAPKAKKPKVASILSSAFAVQWDGKDHDSAKKEGTPKK